MVIPNKAGCDSIIKLNLTIDQKFSNFITVNGTSLESFRSVGSFEWFNCDKPELGVLATTQVFTPTETGNYKVLYKKVACVTESECKNIIVAPNSVEDNLNKFKVSPNPTEDFVTIDLGNMFNDVNLKVYSIEGKLLSNTNFGNTQNIESKLNQEPGIYVLEIQYQQNAPVFLKVIKK